MPSLSTTNHVNEVHK